jgi:LruC domain-containing protein
MPTPIFETVTNYNNTGRTLLRWRWEGASAYDLPINTTAKLRFQAKVKPGTLAGTLPNIAYLLGQANTALNTGSCNTLTADTFDLNGNGNKTETLCGSKTTGANLTVNASAAMESVMQVKGQLDSGYSQYPNSGLTVAGGSLLYRLQVSNVGNVPMKNAQVIDILPLVGDTGVLDPQNRQSAWRPNLIAPVIAPANVVVYYSTVSNPCRAELSYSPSGCATPNWSVTPPDDITQVQALKFDFGNIVLNPLDKLELNWPMRAPIGAPTHGEIAWNSFGFVATRADNSVTLLPSEPVKVGIAVQAPQPPGYGNYVWVDTNANGLQDSNEQGLNGVRVDLYAADGSVVDSTLTTNDGNGKPGFYQFTNLVPGTFHAVFYPPAGYAVTTRNVGSNRAIDSDVDPASNSTVPVTLTWGQIDYNWDLGLQVSKTASIGNYVWNDRNGDGLQNEATNDGVNGVSVKIYASNNTTTPVASVVTDDDLNGNPGYFRFDNLAPGSYFLEFIKPSGANFATRGTTAASSKVDPTTGRTASFSVVAGQYDVSWDAGVVLPVGTASLGDRIWLDANNNGLYEPFSGEQGIDGLRINLYRDTDGNGVFTPNIDQYYTTTTTYTAGGNPGYFSFGQLPPGRFIVQVDPVNFQNGKPLERLLASTVVTDPSNAVDNDNNGYLLAGFGAVSKAVTLTTAAQADLDFGFTATYSLGNRVFFDNGAGGGVTNDGLRNGAEPGIAGVVMKLFAADANGNPTGAVLATQSTDNEGFYRFDGLLYGQYVVVVDKTASSVLKDLVGSNGFAADFNITTDSRDHGKDVPLVKATVLPGGIASAPVSLGPNQQPLGESIGSTQASQNGPDGDANSNLTADFGFVQGYALGDRVWLDRNQDGIQQADERGIAGITVNLYAQDGATLLQSTVTDGSGFYQFPRVGSGTYVVGVAKPEGYSYSPLNQGTTGLKDSFDSDIDPTSGKTAAISFMGNLLTVDVGLYPSNGTAAARIADFVWYDTNHDGLQTANEPGLGGVTVNLWDAARQNLLAVAVSDANGFYEFASLAAGSYVVEFVAPTGYSRSPQQAGANNLDSDAAVATGLASVTVTAGQNADTVDAGFYLTGSQSGNSAAKLGDMVWYDINQDGNRDSGEPGLPGILVRLYASDTGILLAKTKTALDGSYAFAGLAAGNYTVEFVAPTSYAFSPQGHNSLADVKGQVSVQLTSNQSRTDIDAGLAIPGSQPISLGNKIWLDANADLGFDSGEGLAKAQVVLYNGVGQELARVNTSAADANYQFTGLGVGSYRVAVDKSTLPNNAALIADPDGVLDALHDMVNLKTSLISVDFGYSTHIDFGDLANSYATLLVNDGARHAVTGVYLGSRATDVEADGQASVNADADDLNGAAPDDEDGVTFSGAVLTSGQNASLKINASAAAVLNAWADWNHNGLFDGGERIVNNRALTAGQNSVAIAVASNASAGKTAFRFRVTNSQNQGGDSPTGLAKSGEVEDYLQMIYAAGQVGTIGGKVRFDNQGDGNLAAGYNGLAGAVVILYTDPNGDGNPADGMAVDSMVTDADGQYLFAATNTGKYVVVETNPSSYASSNDAVPPNDDRIPVAMPSFTAINGRDFLDAKTLHVGSVVGQVRNDSVGRGNMAGSFQGLSGAGLTLYTDPNGDGDPSDGLPYGATSSDNQGAYRFANLPLGSYVVVEANPVAIPPYFSTNDAVAPGNDDQVRVKLTLASANASGADFLDSQRAQPSIPPVDLQRIASKSLTDGMGNCTGTINPLKDASAQDLETYRLDNGGNLVFGFNVMESKDGTENPQSQGVTVKEARLDVTFSNGRQKSYALSEGACYTETYTLVTEKGGVERKPQYTLIGNDETKREGAVNSHQNTYDSALKCHIPDALDGASTASLSVEFMQTDTSRGDPEAFYDCSGKGEKLAVLNSADRDFVDGYHAGRQDAPAVALTNPTPIPDPMAVASWNYFPSATTYYFVAYEDQYPLLGDYDFNDAIIAYQVKLGMNSDNQVVRIEGVAYLMAKGAAYSHDWHLRMTLPSDVQSLVKCATSLAATPQTSVACTGSSLPLINGTVDLVAFQDTGKLFPNPLFTDYNRVYSNTLQWPVAARTYQKGPKSVFSIALSHPVDVDTVGKAPFDPYLYVRNTKKTVQLLQVNPAMKDVNGYPYAMMMPSTWNWPYERVDIRSSYPKFNTFVSTNATQAVDWYNFPATNSYFQLPVMATWSW